MVNRPGAGGAIGYKDVAAQSAFGHHLVWQLEFDLHDFIISGTMALDYRAFTPVARVLVETPLLVPSRAMRRGKTCASLSRYAKSNPGKLTVGNSGAGSHTHFSAVMLFKAAGAEVTDVPFGAAQVVPSLLGGHVNTAMQLPGALAAQVRKATCASSRPCRRGAIRRLPTCRPRTSRASTSRPTHGAGSRCPKARPPRPLPSSKTRSARPSRALNSSRRVTACRAAPAFLPGPEFGRLIAKEDSELAVVIQSLGLKKSAN